MIFEGAKNDFWLDPAPRRKRWAVIAAALLALGGCAVAWAQQTTPDWVMGGMYNATRPTWSDKQRTIFQTTSDGILLTTPAGSATGGLDTFFLQPAASDNHAVIKAGAGAVYQVAAFNNSATVNYLRLYNATTGFNGCGSATGLVAQFQIPASTAVGGFVIPIPLGLAFSTGISICVSSGYATTDTTNATATAMSITVGYK